MRRILIACTLSTLAASANAAVFSVTVDGTDAIFLAGRTDIVVPDPALPWGGSAGLTRHSGATPEEAKETHPSYIPVVGGDIVKVADPAIGGVNFFNGSAGGLFGPSGNSTASSSSISSLGGISGYIGTQGALTGVFLDAAIPLGPAPATLDFGAIGLDFLKLTPAIGQIFYIGDGVTSGGILQEFEAPTGATRLFLGIPDGFSFTGPPGAYDDNDGSYRVNIGVNETPTTSVPDSGSTFALLGMGIGLAFFIRRRLS